MIPFFINKNGTPNKVYHQLRKRQINLNKKVLYIRNDKLIYKFILLQLKNLSNRKGHLL